MTQPNKCPSSFALLRFATCPDEVDDQLAQHVADCVDCQSIVAEQRAQGETYERSPSAAALRTRLDDLDQTAAPSIGGSHAGRSPTSQSRTPMWAWGGALAAAACLVLVFSGTSENGATIEGKSVNLPDAASSAGMLDTLTPKGGVQLALWVEDAAGASTQLDAAAVLAPGKRVQPTFSAATDGFVALLLTTPAKVVVPLHPAEGEQSASVEAGAPAPLGPSFRLDDEVGTYQLTVYFSESSFSTNGLSAEPNQDEVASFAGVVSTQSFEVRP